MTRAAFSRSSPRSCPSTSREGGKPRRLSRGNACRLAGFPPCILAVPPMSKDEAHLTPAASPVSSETAAAQATPAARAALEARLRETTGLLEVARVVSSATDLAEALRLICHELARLTGAETASAHLLDARTGELRPIAAHGVPKHAVETLAASTLARADLSGLEEVFAKRHLVWSDDASKDPRFAAGPFGRVPHQSALAIPLVFDAEVAGAFFLVWWTQRRRFDAAELVPLAAIGEQAGVLLGNAPLREALEGRAARLRALSRINQVVSSSLDEREVLSAIARAAAELTGASFVSFWVADEAERRLQLRAVSDERFGADLPFTWLEFGQSGVGWVAAGRRMLEVADVFADTRFPGQASWWQGHGFKSFVGVPVLLDGSLLAVLALCGRGAFSLGADERELLESFIAQAAVALRNMRLYAESSLYAQRLETLTGLSRALTASLDPETILPAVVDAALTLFPGRACRLWTVAGDRVRLVAGSGHEDRAEARKELTLGQGLVGEVAVSGRSAIVEDLAALAGEGADPTIPVPLIEAGMVRAEILPLLVANEAVGVVCFFSPSRDPLTPSETKVME